MSDIFALKGKQDDLVRCPCGHVCEHRSADDSLAMKPQSPTHAEEGTDADLDAECSYVGTHSRLNKSGARQGVSTVPPDNQPLPEEDMIAAG
jgi:hypothetical protein